MPISEKKCPPSLPSIGRAILSLLDSCFAEAAIPLSLITHAAIENQLGPIASTMKAVQGMLTQYLIMRGVNDVVYVSASNKLKAFTTERLTYKQRKKLAIEKAREQLCLGPSSDRVAMFDSSKKKDDLADAYLQGLWVTGDVCTT
jgi:hypothetical protein